MKINENYQKLPGNFLFSTMDQKVEAFAENHPDDDIIKLSFGDVTRPLVDGVIKTLHEAVEEQGEEETFRGYGPRIGYSFLRETIAEHDYNERGIDIEIDEIIISDGSKSDVANIQELFGQDIKVAVGDPIYPVYIDSNILAGRLGDHALETGKWDDLVYLPAVEENDFTPELPEESVDVIYLCYPNNPTGAVLTKAELQEWVDYANENNSVIIFDGAYRSYIQGEEVPHSIYDCEGAETCAIEIRTFSKDAGFTGLRLGYTVVPHELSFEGQPLNPMWTRRQSTKFNSAAYIVQKAGEATYYEPTASQIQENIDYYMKNALLLREGLSDAGAKVYGGVNAPYVWLKLPEGISSWEFFDELLNEVQIVGTPGVGFGPSGEGYFRLTGFNTYEKTIEAVKRLKRYFQNK